MISAYVDALKAFAGRISNGLISASYSLAMLYHLEPPPQVIIVGRRTDSQTKELFNAAADHYRPGKEVYIFDPDDEMTERLPFVIRSKMTAGSSDGTAAAFVCIGTACAPPTNSPKTLTELLGTFGR